MILRRRALNTIYPEMPAGFKKMKINTFPKRIEIELTNACNLKCSYCPRRFGVGDEGFMSLSLFRKIIDEAGRHPELILQLHRRGESLLHPDFIQILNYINGRFKEVQIATNAILLDNKKSLAIAETIDFISFSIDLPEKYALRRGVDLYNTVEGNIINFLKVKGKAKTQVSLVKDGSTTEEDIKEFNQIWSDKVDIVRIYEEHSVDGVIGATRQKRQIRQVCIKPFTDMVIYWNGKVVRCNHDWSNLPLADVTASSIESIWQSLEFERIRKEQTSLIFSDNLCKNCDSWYSIEGIQGTGYIFM